MTQLATPTVDVRHVAPRDRHPLIFSTFRQLLTGQAMELVNDHDPRPLFYQFQAELPGGFGWAYLETGPETWRVAITKLVASQPEDADSCCGGGSCAGARA